MLSLSDVLLKHREVSSFREMRELVKTYASRGEIFLAFDVRPPFEDTPEDWETQLEATFTAAVTTRK